MTASAPRTCTDCTQQLDDPSQPCPTCGSTRQTAHISLSETVVATDAIASIRAIFGPDRPWYQKWHDVRKHLEQVELACTPKGYKSIDSVRRVFDGFFIECTHLADWLSKDKSTPLTKDEVFGYASNDFYLNLCRAAANTDKHHTRTDPNALTAKVRSVDTGSDPVEVTIRWSKGSALGNTDGLTMVRECVAAWDRFLKGKGLISPI